MLLFVILITSLNYHKIQTMILSISINIEVFFFFYVGKTVTEACLYINVHVVLGSYESAWYHTDSVT